MEIKTENMRFIPEWESGKLTYIRLNFMNIFESILDLDEEELLEIEHNICKSASMSQNEDKMQKEFQNEKKQNKTDQTQSIQQTKTTETAKPTKTTETEPASSLERETIDAETIDAETIDVETIDVETLLEGKKSKSIMRKIHQSVHRLRSKIDKRKTILIDKEMDLPMIGSINFGIIDRNTNCIELRPLTGCNMNCIHCSVNEGTGDEKDTKEHSKDITDIEIGKIKHDTSNNENNFIVEKEILIDAFREIASIKNEPIEAHINPQGEPLLYSDLEGLIRGINQIDNVHKISMNTNGVLLDEKKAATLIDAGLSQINFSLNAMTQSKADQIYGRPYPLKKVKKTIIFCSKLCDITLSPVLMKGINEEEVEKIIEFSKEIEAHKKKQKQEEKENKESNAEQKKKFKTRMGIQNFLRYKGGRNPTKEMDWKTFFQLLKTWEEKHGVNLTDSFKDRNFQIKKTENNISQPIKNKEIVEVELICEGKTNNETLGKCRDRTVTVIKARKRSGKQKVRIIRAKHNIYYGIAI